MTQDYRDLAYAVLLLERQLESYQKLHNEELEALWKALAELKQLILAMASANADAPEGAENAFSSLTSS